MCKYFSFYFFFIEKEISSKVYTCFIETLLINLDKLRTNIKTIFNMITFQTKVRHMLDGEEQHVTAMELKRSTLVGEMMNNIIKVNKHK